MPFGDSAGRQAPTRMFCLNLQPVQNRLGDRFREGLRNLGAHFIQDPPPGSVGVRFCRFLDNFFSSPTDDLQCAADGGALVYAVRLDRTTLRRCSCCFRYSSQSTAGTLVTSLPTSTRSVADLTIL